MAEKKPATKKPAAKKPAAKKPAAKKAPAKGAALQLGAEMDYKEHNKTYSGFIKATIYTTIVCVVGLIILAMLTL